MPSILHFISYIYHKANLGSFLFKLTASSQLMTFNSNEFRCFTIPVGLSCVPLTSATKKRAVSISGFKYAVSVTPEGHGRCESCGAARQNQWKQSSFMSNDRHAVWNMHFSASEMRCDRNHIWCMRNSEHHANTTEMLLKLYHWHKELRWKTSWDIKKTNRFFIFDI